MIAETSDPSCDPGLAGEGAGPIESLHRIDHGRLGELCHGIGDPVVVAAWEAMAEVAPPAMLDDLTLFGGFRGTGDTMAFAGAVGEAGNAFVIAVDTRALAEREQEMRLTLVHELAHVFTQTPDQLDVEVASQDCETLWNGFGCFRPDSYIAGWIDRFWSDEALATLPVDGAIDEVGGRQRCAADGRFVSSYAASHPEEDFAETFAAWVYSVEVPEALAAKLRYLTGIPELDYESDLYYERTLRSVTASTRRDGEELLRLAAEIPIRTDTTAYPLTAANAVLLALKRREIRGAAVLIP
jgi:hypothetical protein